MWFGANFQEGKREKETSPSGDFSPSNESRDLEVRGMRGGGLARERPIFKELRADNEARGPLMKGPVAIGPLINSFSGSLI